MKNSLTNREQTSVLSKNIIEFNKSTNNSKLPLNKAPKSNVKEDRQLANNSTLENPGDNKSNNPPQHKQSVSVANAKLALQTYISSIGESKIINFTNNLDSQQQQQQQQQQKLNKVYNSSNNNLGNNFNKEFSARATSNNFNNSNKNHNQLPPSHKKASFSSTVNSANNNNPIKLSDIKKFSVNEEYISKQSNVIFENINNADGDSFDLSNNNNHKRSMSVLDETKIASNLKQVINTSIKGNIPPINKNNYDSNINYSNSGKISSIIKNFLPNNNIVSKHKSLVAEVHLTENNKKTITANNDSIIKEAEKQYKLKIVNSKLHSEKGSYSNLNSILKNGTQIKSRLNSGISGNFLYKDKNSQGNFKNQTNSQFYTPFINKNSAKFMDNNNFDSVPNSHRDNFSCKIESGVHNNVLPNSDLLINKKLSNKISTISIEKISNLSTARPFASSINNIINKNNLNVLSKLDNNKIERRIEETEACIPNDTQPNKLNMSESVFPKNFKYSFAGGSNSNLNLSYYQNNINNNINNKNPINFYISDKKINFKSNYQSIKHKQPPNQSISNISIREEENNNKISLKNNNNNNNNNNNETQPIQQNNNNSSAIKNFKKEASFAKPNSNNTTQIKFQINQNFKLDNSNNNTSRKPIIIHKSNLSSVANNAKINIQEAINNFSNNYQPGENQQQQSGQQQHELSSATKFREFYSEKKHNKEKSKINNVYFNRELVGSKIKEANFQSNNIETNNNENSVKDTAPRNQSNQSNSNNSQLKHNHLKIGLIKQNFNLKKEKPLNSNYNNENTHSNNASITNRDNAPKPNAISNLLFENNQKNNENKNSKVLQNSSILYQQQQQNQKIVISIPTNNKDSLIQNNNINPQKPEKIEVDIREKDYERENKLMLKQKVNSSSPESTWIKFSTKETKDKEDTYENILNKSLESNLSKIKENILYQRESLKLTKYIQNYFIKNHEYPKTELTFYKVGRFLGKGAFGKVNLGLHILSGRLVAIKSFNKKKIDLEKLKRKISFETGILRSLHHIHVVNMYETFETEKFFMIIMEYISCGDLLSYVRKRSKLTEPVTKYIYKQIIMALKYIHSKGIAHRDIKLDNILIDINSNIKVCDFGVAKKIKKNEQMTDQCGTPAYIAPEVFKGNGYDGSISDIWSSGVVLYTMLAGTVPFKAGKLPELQKLIIKCQYNKIKGLSEEVEDLLSKVLEPEPGKRLTCDQILNHPWMEFDEVQFKNNIDLFTNSEKIHLSNSNLDFRYADPKEIVEAFTYKNLDTIVKCENSKSKSMILAPFNSSLNDIDNDSFVNYVCEVEIKEINKLNVSDLVSNNFYRELEVLNNALKFDPKVKALNKIYELNNNGEIDNGIIISPKGLSKNNSYDSEKEDVQKKKKYLSNINSKINSKLNSIINSPVPERDNLVNYSSTNQLMNNNISSKYYSQNMINEAVVNLVVQLGFNRNFIIKQLSNNEIDYCTASYYLLQKDNLN